MTLLTTSDVLRARLAIAGALRGPHGMKPETVQLLEDACDKVDANLRMLGGTMAAPPPIDDKTLRQIKATRRAGTVRQLQGKHEPREIEQ